MSLMSFSKILTVIVFCYIFYTLSSFYKIFHIEQCTETSNCIYPMFEDISYELIISGSKVGRSQANNIIRLTNISLKNDFLKYTNFSVPKSVINNQSYTITIDLVPVINQIAIYDKKITSKMSLTKLRRPMAESFNLLKNNQGKEDKTNKVLQEMHIYNKVVINTLSEDIIFDYRNIPQEMVSLLKVSRSPDRRMIYQPIAFGNNFVLRDEDLMRVSHLTDRTVNISVEIMPISLGKLRLWRLIEHSTDDLAKLGFNDKSVESVRGIFTHTNFYLLVVTFSVAALHLLFDVLSFKNDISFWRRAKSTEGLSGRTVLWRCVSSVIIFFYLLEEETSLLVLVPFAVSTLIEFWKLAKVLKVDGVSVTGRVHRGVRDRGEAATDRYDSEGMRYLLWLVMPLCVVGAGYSLLYLPHKSWYSWTVHTLANGVYVFGFLFMLPQLFINYKLQSVAHLPWKALTYKAFNTFIDDFFAFIITMPTSHRLACFRDDVVFLVFLYQKWLYPVDRSRVNEFGDSFESAPQPPIDTAKKEI